jgi:hypothetical protein
MSRVNRRTRLGILSLVSGSAAAVLASTDHHATSAEPLPEGWFCDEVGYVGDAACEARIRTRVPPTADA